MDIRPKIGSIVENTVELTKIIDLIKNFFFITLVFSFLWAFNEFLINSGSERVKPNLEVVSVKLVGK